MEYVNPDERKRLYEELKKTHFTIFNKRVEFLEKLNGLDIIRISKSYCNKWIEETKNYNEKA